MPSSTKKEKKENKDKKEKKEKKEKKDKRDKKDKKDKKEKKPKVEDPNKPKVEKKPKDEVFGAVYFKKTAAPRMIRPRKDMTRFVKFPKMVRIQRQKRILIKRLKIPPTIHQLSRVANKPLANTIVQFLAKYKPPTKHEQLKKVRELAKQKKEGKEVKIETPKEMGPKVISGIDNVVRSIEQKRAKLVILPHHIQNPEMLSYVPSLCQKLEVPYAIIKGTERLGSLVHLKKTSAVCLNEIKKEDKEEFDQLVESVKGSFNSRYITDLGRKWGGGKLSKKSLDMRDKGLISD